MPYAFPFSLFFEPRTNENIRRKYNAIIQESATQSISENWNPEMQDYDDLSIHDAVIQGKLNTVKTLLRHDTSLINQLNDERDTPLHLAAKHGKEGIAQLLLKRHASLTQGNMHKNTPLHVAVISQQTALVKILVQHRAPLHLKNDFGSNVLHLAAKRETFEITRFLLGQDASLINQVDIDKNTPFHLAIEFGKEANASLLYRPKFANQPNAIGQTPLCLAARRPNFTNIKLLIRHPDINLNYTTRYEDVTPLEILARYLAIYMNPSEREAETRTEAETETQKKNLINCMRILILKGALIRENALKRQLTKTYEGINTQINKIIEPVRSQLQFPDIESTKAFLTAEAKIQDCLLFLVMHRREKHRRMKLIKNDPLPLELLSHILHYLFDQKITTLQIIDMFHKSFKMPPTLIKQNEIGCVMS